MSQEQRCRGRRQHRCRGQLIRLFWLLFPHACLVLSLVLYSLLGAFVFYKLEQSGHNETELKKDVLRSLWSVSRSNLTYGDFKEQAVNLISRYNNATIEWTFLSSLFFCFTVFSTIGYGRMAPITTVGRIVTMIYAAIGIPLMLLLLADLGDILAVFMSRAYNYILDFCHRCCSPKSINSLKRGRESSRAVSSMDSQVSIKEPLSLTDIIKNQELVKTSYLQLKNLKIFELLLIKDCKTLLPKKGPHMRCYSCPELDIKETPHPALIDFKNLGKELDQLDVPFLMIIFVVMAFIMLGAFILTQWERWDTLEAFYFCFITLSTIGFGDIFPEHPNFFLLLSVYTVLGMAIICMAFKLMQNRMVSLYRKCITYVSRGEVYRVPRNNQS
ncbi:potassium channel subfamily K member 18 [Hyla sarda]|uniref:potassium channel subfamily K member 18 n=1 Tax=Hyla sarda TaxID=327740 RepID=UPI0024C21DDC|nr:potassium channel subfamily K member 18 [Hyla sarda]